MLRVEGLSFFYDRREVLKGVSFELEGGVGCLLGPNGAGKSTLLKCIAGILNGKGEITLDGTELSALSLREWARLVSYSPQEFSLTFPYTVFETVLMGRNPYIDPVRGPGKGDEEIARDTLRVLGLESLADRPFSGLSGGQKRLVMIARTLAQGGRLFLFDEPTSFLDFRNQHLVLSVIRKLSRDRTVLVSLHDPNQAMAFCDTVFLLKEGRIIARGRPGDVLTEEKLRELYGMRVKRLKADGAFFISPVEVVE